MLTACHHWAKQWNKVLFTFPFKLTIEMCYFATCTILDAILQCVMQSLAISSLWLSLLSFIAFIVVPLFFELTAPQVSSWFVWSTGVIRENKHPPVEFVADRSNHFSSRLFDKFSSMYWWRQKMKKKNVVWDCLRTLCYRGTDISTGTYHFVHGPKLLSKSD